MKSKKHRIFDKLNGYIAAVIGFFLLATAYLRGCEALRKGETKKWIE
ncbi:MAG: hypothetical protein H0U50_03235 [Pyrinomonadaceae bacterium]|nr:hypothetical protein [Pyrinomonadaceae bacterium]